MSEKLREIFYKLIDNYSKEEMLKANFWQEVTIRYQHENRHYHNFSHLKNMIDELYAVEHLVSDFDSLLFSVFYHDIIYNPALTDNEEKSAELAKLRLEELNLPVRQIRRIYSQIIATKSHRQSEDTDANYLLDADLAILGQSWEKYLTYTKQIRTEYSIYPDVLYNAGRKEVLQKFLDLDKIFKTAYFENKYESQAQQNLQKEIGCL